MQEVQGIVIAVTWGTTGVSLLRCRSQGAGSSYAQAPAQRHPRQENRRRQLASRLTNPPDFFCTIDGPLATNAANFTRGKVHGGLFVRRRSSCNHGDLSTFACDGETPLPRVRLHRASLRPM